MSSVPLDTSPICSRRDSSSFKGRVAYYLEMNERLGDVEIEPANEGISFAEFKEILRDSTSDDEIDRIVDDIFEGID